MKPRKTDATASRRMVNHRVKGGSERTRRGQRTRIYSDSPLISFNTFLVEPSGLRDVNHTRRRSDRVGITGHHNPIPLCLSASSKVALSLLS